VLGLVGESADGRQPLHHAELPWSAPRMLPELDLSRSIVSVDADVCLDEPGDENRRCPKSSRHGLKLPQPASGVDEGAPFP
jgi:hypothetical protein